MAHCQTALSMTQILRNLLFWGEVVLSQPPGKEQSLQSLAQFCSWGVMSDCARTDVVTKGVMHSAMSNRTRASPQRLGGSNIMQGRMFNGLCLLLFLFPSFIIFSSAPQQKRDRLDRYRQASMTVHKTQVNMSEKRELSKRVKSVDPNNKPHPLKICRVFRKKSLEDRKQFIKEQLVCFRCCSSIDHMAKKLQSWNSVHGMWQRPSCFSSASWSSTL